MSSDEIRERTQTVWDRFYEMRSIWKRSGLYADLPGAGGVFFPVEAVSADVCRYGYFDR